MLTTEHLSKIYKSGNESFQALSDVSLEINAGDCLAIVGKSGSGKSTLMHLLALLDTPTSGNIYFQGEDISKFSQKKQNLFRNERFGFVFQQFFLAGRDTVLENVLLPLKIRGIAKSERNERAFHYLEVVGLKEKARKATKDLSGGEKQRVCIARALVGEPGIIFADEPTGNLDSVTGSKIEEILFSLHHEKGIAIAIVTHDEELAGRCPRAIELRDGQIVSQR